MPHLIERCFAAVGVDDGRAASPCGPSTRCTGPATPTGRSCASATAARRWPRRSAPCAGRAEADAFVGFCDWLTELYELEMPGFIERELRLARSTSPARSGRALELVRLGGFRKLAPVVARYFDDERLRRIFSFQAMYAGLAPYEALAIYAVITYMDTVNGVFVPEGGMHALPVALGRRRRAGRRRDSATTPRSSGSCCATAQRARCAACGSASGEVVAGDAVVANPDLPGGLPHAAARASTPPRRRRRGHYSPSARRVARRRARRRCPPAWSTTTSTSAHEWDGVVPGAARRRRPHARPVDPGERAAASHEPTMAPPDRHVALRPRAGPQPRRPASTGRTERRRVRADLLDSPRPARLPDRRSRSRSSSTRSTGRPRAWSGARRSRCPTASARPVRSARATSSAGLRAWCSPARAPCPGVGVPDGAGLRDAGRRAGAPRWPGDERS